MNRLLAYKVIGQVLAGQAPNAVSFQKPSIWPTLINVASHELVAPALCRLLLQKHRLELPKNVKDYCQKVCALHQKRTDHITQQIFEVLKALNNLGIEPVLLKGAASNMTELYACAADRVVSDIDILVPLSAISACENQLKQQGYCSVSSHHNIDYEHSHHHATPLLHPDYRAAVELHRDYTRLDSARNIIDVNTFHHQAVTKIKDGVAYRIPSTSHRLWHNFVHAQLADRGYRRGEIKLRPLWEWHLLANQQGKTPPEWMSQALSDSSIEPALSTYQHAAQDVFSNTELESKNLDIRARLWYWRTKLQITHHERLNFFRGYGLEKLLFNSLPR